MKQNEKDFLKEVVKIITSTDESVKGLSYEEYSMQCTLNGVECSLDDDNFVSFIVEKAFSERELNYELFKLVCDGLSKLKFLNVLDNPYHAYVAGFIFFLEITRSRDAASKIADYCMQNFPKADITKKIFKVAYACGITMMNYDELLSMKKEYDNDIS